MMRPIVPLVFTGIRPINMAGGPGVDWDLVAPTDIHVDDSYPRESRRRIRCRMGACERHRPQVKGRDPDGTGRPWTSDAFKKAWAKAAGGDGFDGLHFRDLRGAAVTMLSEADCSIQEMAAITGHSLAGAQKIVDTYLSRTRHMVESAIAKLEKRPRNVAAKDLRNRLPEIG